MTKKLVLTFVKASNLKNDSTLRMWETDLDISEEWFCFDESGVEVLDCFSQMSAKFKDGLYTP